MLRQAAAFLEVDTAFVSKLECNEGNASQEQVEKLAEFLNTQSEELITIWLADKVMAVSSNNKQVEAALKLVLKNCKQK